MRGVLVDDDQAVAGLGQHIGLMQLRPGGPQGMVLQRRWGFGLLDAEGRGRDWRRVLHPRAGFAEPRQDGGGRGSAPQAGAAPARGGRRARSLGPEAAEGGGGDGGRAADPGAGQGVAQRPHHQAAHQARVAEAHLRLGRVDVHIDLGGVELEVEGRGRVAVAGEDVGVGGPQRPLQQPVANGPPVDEQMLVGAVAPGIGGQAGVARQPHPLALLVDPERIGLELASEHRGEAGEPAFGPGRLGGQAQAAPPVQVEGEAHRLVGHGLAPDLLGDRRRLGPLRLHELEPGRRGEEQVAHLDPRPVRTGEGAGGHRAHRARVDGEAAGLRSGPPGGEAQPGDRADRGQGLAAEAEAGDAQEIEDAVGVRRQL